MTLFFWWLCCYRGLHLPQTDGTGRLGRTAILRPIPLMTTVYCTAMAFYGQTNYFSETTTYHLETKGVCYEGEHEKHEAFTKDQRPVWTSASRERKINPLKMGRGKHGNILCAACAWKGNLGWRRGDGPRGLALCGRGGGLALVVCLPSCRLFCSLTPAGCDPSTYLIIETQAA